VAPDGHPGPGGPGNGVRVLILGGTRFIGRRIAVDLLARGDEVVVAHRGEAEPAELADCQHVHVARSALGEISGQLHALRPDAVIDTRAMTRADATAVLPFLPDVPVVLLSSIDVYRAYELLLAGQGGEPVPLTETSPVRSGRYPLRDLIPDLGEHYDKLDVEPLYLERGACVLRLSMIYGEHDGQRREEFVLRRVRAGRRRIPVGPGTSLDTRCYVGDVAAAVLAALDRPSAAGGEVFNVGDLATDTVRDYAGRILAAAGFEASLVTVPESVVPDDLEATRSMAQHFLVDSRKAATVLGWQPSDPATTIPVSVRWHLDHPPADADQDFSADDRALAAG
jgi:nucleoside-diphosphate-sugar epimerase